MISTEAAVMPPFVWVVVASLVCLYILARSDQDGWR